MTVVLCGSLGATAAMWTAQRDVFGEDVVTVEHPGHGGAPIADVPDMGSLARHVLEQVDARTFSFVGLSLGGSIGMRIALDAPERVERLVLCCTAARFGPPEQWRERAALVREQGLEPIVDVVLARWFTPAFADVARFRAMFLSVEPEGYARCCEALATWDVLAELERITAPTLCFAGDDDPTAPPEELQRIADAIPGARTVVIPGRHLATVEYPDDANAHLREFLA